MATKWKNSGWLLGAAAVILFGWYLASITYFRVGINDNKLEQVALTELEAYYTRDYFKRNQNQDKASEIKQVTDDQVELYRNYYGELGEQVNDIQKQFQAKIQKAKEENQKQQVKNLTTERDTKIKEIIDNFTDAEIVKQKIVSEEHEYLNKNKRDILETIDENAKSFNQNYQFYLKNVATGEVYTNLPANISTANKSVIQTQLKKRGVGKLMDYQTSVGISSYIDEAVYNKGLFYNDSAVLEGQVIVKKGSPLAKSITDYQKELKQVRFVFVLGMTLFIVGWLLFYIYLRKSQIELNTSKWYLKIRTLPIDARIVVSLVMGLFSAITSGFIQMNQLVSEEVTNWQFPEYVFSKETILLNVGYFIFGFILLGGSLIGISSIWEDFLLKNREQLLSTWKSSISYYSYLKVKNYLLRLSIGSKVRFMALTYIASGCLLWQVFKSSASSFSRGLFIFILLTGVLWFTQKISKYCLKIQELLKQPEIIIQKVTDDFSNNSNKKDNNINIANVSENFNQLNDILLESTNSNQRSQELKTELLTNVSHDLRTPLTSIITYGSLLQQVDLDKERQKEAIEIINKKAFRMKVLIDDLFEVTKMNNGEIILKKTKINLGQLLQQSIAEYSDKLTENQLKILYTKPKNKLLINLDGERIWQVFDNLIGNIVKYGMPGTRVYLKVEQENQHVKIELKNISRYELHESAENLLEKFKRGDESRNTEGSGLGLAIANSIILLHGGQFDIKVDGDMFKVTITLPLDS